MDRFLDRLDAETEESARNLMKSLDIEPPPNGESASDLVRRACREAGVGRSRAVPLPGTLDPFAIQDNFDEVVRHLREIMNAPDPA